MGHVAIGNQVTQMSALRIDQITGNHGVNHTSPRLLSLDLPAGHLITMPLTHYYTFKLKATTNFPVQGTTKQTKESTITTGGNGLDCPRDSPFR